MDVLIPSNLFNNPDNEDAVYAIFSQLPQTDLDIDGELSEKLESAKKKILDLGELRIAETFF